MTPKQSVTPAAAGADYESYLLIVKIVNEGVSRLVSQVIGKLADPDSFASEVRDLAANQAISPAFMEDPVSFYRAFWALGAGIDSDFRWLSNAGVSVHSHTFAESFPNPVYPSARPFRIGLGYSW